MMRKLFVDRRGTAAVELALVLGLITLAVFGSLVGLGGEATKSFNSTSTKVQAASTAASS